MLCWDELSVCIVLSGVNPVSVRCRWAKVVIKRYPKLIKPDLNVQEPPLRRTVISKYDHTTEDERCFAVSTYV
jgi:hypothetical protein